MRAAAGERRGRGCAAAARVARATREVRGREDGGIFSVSFLFDGLEGCARACSGWLTSEQCIFCPAGSGCQSVDPSRRPSSVRMAPTCAPGIRQGPTSSSGGPANGRRSACHRMSEWESEPDILLRPNVGLVLAMLGDS